MSFPLQFLDAKREQLPNLCSVQALLDQLLVQEPKILATCDVLAELDWLCFLSSLDTIPSDLSIPAYLLSPKLHAFTSGTSPT